MDVYVPSYLIDLLLISSTISIIVMALIQKFKTLSFINKTGHVWFLNLVFSFALGTPFGMYFYNLSLEDGLWVSVFCFIGAPTIYDALKNQNIINYKPMSLSDKKSDNIVISKENEIKRDD